MMHCVANGHEIIALANLRPASGSGKDELDSYMYQTVGHDAIDLYSGCMGIPLFRREIKGSSVSQGADYRPTDADEVEDLYELLSEVKNRLPEVEGVASGAILSNYQRVRVENVCSRLGLTSFAYLWRRDQRELMEDMIATGLNAILIKVAAMGLKESHLGQSLQQVFPHLLRMHERFEAHICGEGGEFETLTLDCPLFLKRIVIDEVETVIHSDDAVAIVAYLQIKKAHLEDKPTEETSISNELRERLMEKPAARIDTMVNNEMTSLMEEPIAYEPLVQDMDSQLEPTVSITETRWKPPYFSIPGTTITDLPSARNVTGSYTLEEETKLVLDYIGEQLRLHDLHWDHVVMMHVYVRDMASFARLNAVYRTYFDINPPPRVTVEVALPPPAQIQVDCIAYKHADSMRSKETLHVQSVSYWAPANIGPYSQAASVSDHIYVAGQIGLIPHTMQLPTSTPSETPGSALLEEATISLRSLGRIIDATGASLLRDAAGGICYLADAKYITVVRRLWEMTLGAEAAAKVPILFIAVPHLPRDAQVEWQILFGRRLVYSHMGEEDGDIDQITSGEAQAEILHAASDPWKCRTWGWRRGTLCCITAECGLIDNLSPLTASTLQDACEFLLRPAVESLSRLTSGRQSAGNIIMMRIFYHSRIPKENIKEAVVSLMKVIGSLPPITFVPASHIGESRSILSLFLHASSS